jgi:hypothetical protein
VVEWCVTDKQLTRLSARPVTVERIERAIRIVADMMLKHERRGLIDTIRRLEDERDRLRNETDPLEYARQIILNVHNNMHNMERSETS